MVFDWSNRMIGSEDPEYQIPDTDPGEAAMQVYSYAEELASADACNRGRTSSRSCSTPRSRARS